MARTLPRGLAALLLAGCGGGADVAPQSTTLDACKVGEAQLARQLGPELKKVVLRTPLPPPGEDAKPAPPGCALVYEPVGEEMPSELPMGETMEAGADHQLAIALADSAGSVVLTMIDPSKPSPGRVRLVASARDVDADGQAELVIEESDGEVESPYRGLRVFAYAPGVERARELFAEALRVTTAEGLTIVPTWKTGAIDGKRAIIYDGAGTYAIYTFDSGTRTFTFDEAATAAKNPKPAAEPAPPIEGQPAPGDAAPADGEKKPMFDLP
jgi:hypothetical protein